MVESFVEQVQPALVSALVTVTIALVTALSVAAVTLIGKARARLEQVSADEGWRAVVAAAASQAEVAVRAAEQTIGADLRKLEPLGKLDALQAGMVLSHAVDDLRTALGPRMLERVAAELTPARVDAFLRSQIEAAVQRLKQPKLAVDVSGTPPTA